MLKRRTEIDREVRQLEAGCHFCLQPNTIALWYAPNRPDHPYQVRCSLCEASGPACDCGEESAVPMWLGVQPIMRRG